jgi:hypothetical protein
MPYDNDASAELAVTFLLGDGDPALSREWTDEDRKQLVDKVHREIWRRVPADIRDSWTAAALRISPGTLTTPEERLALARRMLAELDEEVEGHSIAATVEDGCSYVYTDHVQYCTYTLKLTLSEDGGEPEPWVVRHQPEGKREQVLPLRLCMRWGMPLAEGGEIRPQPRRSKPTPPPTPDRERSR